MNENSFAIEIHQEQDDRSKSKPHNATEQDNKNKSKLHSAAEQYGKGKSVYDAIEQGKSKPHKGRSVTKIEVSPNGNYLVTYSEKDHSIIGWNVNEIDEGRLEPDFTVKTSNKLVSQICVSNDMRLAYIYQLSDVVTNVSKLGKQ
jgi:WD40 repeat protein